IAQEFFLAQKFKKTHEHVSCRGARLYTGIRYAHEGHAIFLGEPKQGAACRHDRSLESHTMRHRESVRYFLGITGIRAEYNEAFLEVIQARQPVIFPDYHVETR